MKIMRVDSGGNRTIVETRFTQFYRPRQNKWWFVTMKPKLIPDIIRRDFKGRPFPIIQTLTFDGPAINEAGFSTMSMIVTVLCLGVLVLILSPMIAMYREGRLEMVDGQVVKTTCVRGYEFVQVGNGQARQVFDAQGHGVPCREAGR